MTTHEDKLVVQGRGIPGLVMDYVRTIAVEAVEERGYSPALVIDVLGFSRSCIYTWLRRYRERGFEGLQTQSAPGGEATVTDEMDQWLRETVLHSIPVDHGYDTVLWTREILADLLNTEFGVEVTGRTVSLHLRKLRLSYQKPCYRAVEQDPAAVEQFLAVTFPSIRRLAMKIGADIAFEDETGVGMRTRSGRTWGQQGETPKVVLSDARGGFNVLSTVTAQGTLRYTLSEDTLNSERYIAFLKDLLRGRSKPLIVVADHASFHKSKKIREFVRAHRDQLRMFFLPKHSPELNPDEQVWEEIKDNRIGRQPLKDKVDLKRRLHASLKSLQHCAKRVISFFQLPDTQYAAI